MCLEEEEEEASGGSCDTFEERVLQNNTSLIPSYLGILGCFSNQHSRCLHCLAGVVCQSQGLICQSQKFKSSIVWQVTI